MSLMKETSQLAWTPENPDGLSGDVDSTAWARQTLHHADWLNRILEQIQNLDRHQLNWDSYGALPTSPMSIRIALVVAEGLSKYDSIEAPDISATPDGFVAFGWGLGDWSLDADIEPDGQIVYAFSDRLDENLDHDGVFFNWSQLADIVCQAFESQRMK